VRTIDWVDGAIELIDQTALPERVEVLRITTIDALIDAIARLAVRGAPALGVAGALGVALLAQEEPDPARLRLAAAGLRAARPTAVNLGWGVDRALARAVDGPAAVLAEALAVIDEDVAACTAMGRRGADLLTDLVGDRPLSVLTICNTGGLCAVERGTALGVVQTLHERGRLRRALVAETRPLLQGARLTAWELGRMGARYDVVVDSAASFLLSSGEAELVLIGADRIAANGDTANKVGSLSLALGAAHAGVPFVVVAPEATIDHTTPDGSAIEIEDRGAAEVVEFGGRLIAPAGATAINPAFDITPRALITALVTERRVVELAAGEALAG